MGRFSFPEVIPIRDSGTPGRQTLLPGFSALLLPTRTFCGEAVHGKGGGGGAEVVIKGAEGAVGGGRVLILIPEVLTGPALCLEERRRAVLDRASPVGMPHK